MMAAFLLVSAASGEPVHWVGLPTLPDGTVPVSPGHHPDGVLALGQGREVVLWDGSAWREVAPRPPLTDPVWLDDAPDGSLFAMQGMPALVARWDGAAWEAPETPGASFYLQGLHFDRDGGVWATFSQGAVTRRRPEDGVWTVVTGGGSQDAVVSRAVALPEGGALLWQPNLRVLLRSDGGPPAPVELPAPGLALQGADDGPPLLAGDDGVFAWDGGTWTRRSDRPSALATSDGDGTLWTLSGASLLRVAGGVEEPVPLPSRAAVWQVAARGGTLWLALGSGQLYRTVPGRAPALRPTAVPGLGALGDLGSAAAGDLDGDGLDDLVFLDDARTVRVLLQRADRFDDATARLGLDLHASWVRFGLCDLDEDGRDDLVAAGAFASEPEARVRVLRALSGWFEEAPVPPVGPPDSHSRIRCADVEGDGDADVWVTSVGVAGQSVRALALYENTGHGHLAAVPLPVRGAKQEWTRDVLTDDLDADGLPDVVVVAAWNDGHRLWKGLPGGRLLDATPGSSLDAVYATPLAGWLVRADADPHRDLLVWDAGTGLRLYRGQPGLRFADATGAAGLASMALGGWPGSEAYPGAVAAEDLDGDGLVDPFACPPEARCRLLAGTAEGTFADRTAAVPPEAEDAVGVVPIDLGADGDLDLLVLRRGDELVLENAEDERGGVAVPVAAAAFGVGRRLAWARPLDGGVGAVLVLAVGLAHLRCRRGRAALVLGRGGVAGAMALAFGAAWMHGLDRSPGARVALSAGLAIATLAGAEVEVRWARARAATRVAGYRLEARLGAGGMGTVWRAVDPRSGRRVALKLVNPEVLARDEDRRLFRREAELGAKIVDPRVVRILAWGDWTLVEGGVARPTAWLAMELLEGATLRCVLEDRRRLPASEAAAVAHELATALETVHAHGVVHRDVKPENTLLLAAGGLKLMDFGAAREAGQVTRSARQVLGTLGYLAPEQARGRPPDPRSDVYALGVVLYEALSGRRPYVAHDLLTLLVQLVEQEPPALGDLVPDLPEGLAAVVHRAIARDPGARFPSAWALAEALAPFRGALPAVRTVRPPSRAVAPGDLAPAAPDHLSLAWRLARQWLRSWRSGGPADLLAFAATLVEEAEAQTTTARSHDTLARLVRAGQRMIGERPTTGTGGPAPERAAGSVAPTRTTGASDETWVEGEEP